MTLDDTCDICGAIFRSNPESSTKHSAPSILTTAEDTLKQRGKERDVEQERSMKRIVETFNTLTGHKLSETEGWGFMVILKLVRSQNGGFKLDDYVDMSAYAALMGESHST